MLLERLHVCRTALRSCTPPLVVSCLCPMLCVLTRTRAHTHILSLSLSLSRWLARWLALERHKQMAQHEMRHGSEATKGDQMPEAVTNFLQRLVAHRQKFPGVMSAAADADADAQPLTARFAGGGVDKPEHRSVFLEDGSYLFPSERVALNLEDGVDRAAEITAGQARYLIAQFLLGRILVLEVLPSSCVARAPCLVSPFRCLRSFPPLLAAGCAVRAYLPATDLPATACHLPCSAPPASPAHPAPPAPGGCVQTCCASAACTAGLA